MPCAAHLTACSMSASSVRDMRGLKSIQTRKHHEPNMIVGLFPPSSRVTLFKLLIAAAAMIFLPVSVLPVNAILSIPRCSLIACPTLAPYPFTTLITPGGKPASLMSEATRRAERGVSSDGLSMTVLPTARAGPSLREREKRGTFQGMIQPCEKLRPEV